MVLWRPVGLREAALVFESDMRGFPPRLAEQPIFYPVLVERYADEIAERWNTKEPAFAGYVFQMEIPDEYGAQFPAQLVGASVHRELWVPAEGLDEFNDRLVAPIVPRRAFFSERFLGHVPDGSALQGANAFEQISRLAWVMDHSPMDLAIEVSANALTIFLNYPFWTAAGANRLGLDQVQFKKCLDCIRHAWTLAPRPAPLIEKARCVL